MRIQEKWSLPGNLEQVMRSMTNREYLTRLAWLEEDWREPNRSDYYLMQIAAEIRRVLSKKPNRIKLKHFKLQFGSSSKSEREKQAKSSKSTWFQILGISKPDNDVREADSTSDR